MQTKITLWAFIAFICLNSIAQAQVPTNGLVAWYPFAGNANDASGNGNNGTVNGATLTIDRFGQTNSAYSFDGINDNINCGNGTSLQISGDISVCLWIKTTTNLMLTPVAKYEAPYAGWEVVNRTSGKIWFGGRVPSSYCSSNESSVIINNNIWHFIVGQRIGTQWRIYVDGLLSNSNECSAGSFINAKNLKIGSESNDLYFFNGVIDDIRLYNRALTPSEITSIYNEGYTPTVQASSINFSNVQTNQLTSNWTDGNGSKRAVFVKQDNTGSALPVNNITYNANTSFGSGTQIGTTGWYCVFNGTAHSTGVTVTNLTPNTTYRVMVCEYNGVAGAEQYNTSSATNNPNNKTTCSGAIPTNGLFAWYPFNGNANDVSGNGNNGVVYGATPTIDRFGNLNSSYSFNGIDSYINLGPLNTEKFTHSFWVYKNSQGGNFMNSLHADIGKNYKYVEHGVGVGLTVEMGNGSSYTYLYTGYSLPPNSWHHVVSTFNGDSLKVYVDGVLKGAKDIPTYVFDSADTWVGKNPLSGSTLDGKIDDIHFYNRALSECEIQALFLEPASFVITLMPNPVAGGSVTGGGIYYSGSLATAVASLNPGYNFLNWTENGNVVSTNSSYSFNVTGNRNLVANFVLQQFTVSTSSNPSAGGTTSGGGIFNYGVQATVIAIPSPGYNFLNWTENGNVVSTNSSYSFNVTGNRNLVANFVLQQFTVSTSSNPSAGGTTSGGGIYNYGVQATVIATPSSNYTFLNWTENGNIVSTMANYTFTITANRALIANFTQLPTYIITTISSPSTGGSTSGGGNYTSGQTATINAVPNQGWIFVSWTENGNTISTSPNFSFIVTSNQNLTANFIIQQVTVTTSSSPISGGSTSGGGTYNYGSLVTVSALANSGWVFSYWSDNGSVVSTNQNYSFTATSDRNLVSNFVVQSTQYAITATPNPTNAGSTAGGGSYNSGTIAMVSAFANAGWVFVNWTEYGSQVSTNPMYSFTVTENRNLVANFVNEYIVTAIAAPVISGYTTGGGAYAAGQTVTLTAVPNYGWSFYNWTENGAAVSTNPFYSFVVNSNRSFQANFLPVVGICDFTKSELQIFPNPTKGIIEIKSENPIKDISIYNSSGVQVVYQSAHTSEMILDLTKYSKGVYFIHMNFGEKFVIQKIILL